MRKQLAWNIHPGLVVPFDMINPQHTIVGAMKDLVRKNVLHKNQTVVVIGSLLVGDQILDAVQMRAVG